MQAQAAVDRDRLASFVTSAKETLATDLRLVEAVAEALRAALAQSGRLAHHSDGEPAVHVLERMGSLERDAVFACVDEKADPEAGDSCLVLDLLGHRIEAFYRAE